MATYFIAENPWAAITKAAKANGGPSYVAVAYFSKGAAKLLPLSPSSRLVVDASDATVKSGQTCPHDLKRLQSCGVRIYSKPNLHAKVFVFGTTAFVGSNNASIRSAMVLQEAALVTTERDVVAQARGFVKSNCLGVELGPKALNRLARIYRPPQIHGPKVKGSRLAIDNIERLRIERISEADVPVGFEGVAEGGAQAASKLLRSKREFEVDYAWYGKRWTHGVGCLVMYVMQTTKGIFVCAPGRVTLLRDKAVSGKRKYFVYIEKRKVRDISRSDFGRKLGTGGLKRLKRSGWVDEEWKRRILAVWKD